VAGPNWRRAVVARLHALRFYWIRIDCGPHIRPRLNGTWQGNGWVRCRVWIRITGRKLGIRIRFGGHFVIVAGTGPARETAQIGPPRIGACCRGGCPILPLGRKCDRRRLTWAGRFAVVAVSLRSGGRNRGTTINLWTK